MKVVVDAQQRFTKGQIAILTRNNQEVGDVTQWLLQAGIAVQSERTSDIKAHPLIGELISFLNFLNKPLDNLFFAEFILGDLFYLASGLSPEEIQDFLFSADRPFKEAYPEIWTAFFEDFLNQRGIYPLYELMVGICQRFRCFEFFPEAQGFISHLLELIKRKEEEGCDIETFLTYFDAMVDEDRYVPGPRQDAVKVSTIHKSKGLEFDVVIIPFLEMSIKAGSTEMEGSQTFVWDQDEEGMHLMRLKESYTRFSPVLKERYAQEFKESFFAELNTVYVALTRAVWELYVFVPARAGNSVNPASLLFPESSFSMGEAVKPDHQDHRKEARLSLPMLASKTWMNHLQEEFVQKVPTQTDARLKGDMVHFCLSKISHLTETNASSVIEAAVSATIVKYGKDFKDEPLRKKIYAIVDHPQWKEFFYLPEEARLYCEQEVVNRYGDTKRLDRLIIHAKEVVVIDFKTSRADEASHQQQVDEYVALLKVLYPHHRVNGLVLYINE